MRITRVDDAEAAAQRAAHVLAEVASAARVVRREAHLCLAGGTTPLRSYELLSERVDDWELVHLWYGDERCVPPDHPDSNYGQSLSRLAAPGAVVHRIAGELGPDEGAALYSDELDGTVLDVTLLGMGPDGHIASLFPNHPLLDATGVAVAIHDSPKPPPERITLTLPKINESRRIVLLVAGTDKADAVARMLAGPDRGTPVSLLERERLELVADEAALSAAPRVTA